MVDGQTGQSEIAHGLVLKKVLESVTILHHLVEERTAVVQLLKLWSAVNTLALMHSTQLIIVSTLLCT